MFDKIHSAYSPTHSGEAAVIGHEWHLNESPVKSLKSGFLLFLLLERQKQQQSVVVIVTLRGDGVTFPQVTGCQQTEKILL